jgi:hypothetical protein
MWMHKPGTTFSLPMIICTTDHPARPPNMPIRACRHPRWGKTAKIWNKMSTVIEIQTENE